MKIYEKKPVVIVPLDNINISTKDENLKTDIKYIISKIQGIDKNVFQMLYDGYTQKQIKLKLKIGHKKIKDIIQAQKNKFLI